MKKFVPAAAVVFGVLTVLAVFVWQAVAAHGNPDPATRGLSPAAMILSSGVVVFREGLEAILVLAAVTAGMARTGRRPDLRAVPVGGALALLASAATWFLVVAVVSHIHAPLLAVQAGTGLLAIVVLLVIMNWFFHKVYWTGWITNHANRRKRIVDAEAAHVGSARTFWGLALLGFTAIYREGFEIVLFLQNLRLRAGDALVLTGTAVGLGLTALVAVLTFAAHRKLPYKKMLVATGVLLGLVLLVMVGEEAQEMQLAGWLHTTALPLGVPAWMGVWFSVFPTAETLAAQALAALLVIGSYLAANRSHHVGRPPTNGPSAPRVRRSAWGGASLRAGVWALGLLILAAPARAHRRDFPITYDWLQPSKGERELELKTHYGARSRESEHEIELEYGVTDRFMVAPYLVYGHSPGDSLHLAAFKVETRYQLGQYAPGRLLPGLYLEYEKPQGEPGEMEGKLIVSRYSGHGADASLNLVAERALARGTKTRYAVTFGYAADLGRHGVRGGVEAYKDLDSGRINAGPVVAFSPGPNLWMNAGYAPAINGHGHEDRLNASLEYEF